MSSAKKKQNKTKNLKRLQESLDVISVLVVICYGLFFHLVMVPSVRGKDSVGNHGSRRPDGYNRLSLLKLKENMLYLLQKIMAPKACGEWQRIW